METQPRMCIMSPCAYFGSKVLAFEARGTGEEGQDTGRSQLFVHWSLTLVAVFIEHFW